MKTKKINSKCEISIVKHDRKWYIGIHTHVGDIFLKEKTLKKINKVFKESKEK